MKFKFALFSLLLTWGACTQRNGKLFKIRQGEDIGIDFKNTILTNDTLNALSYEYIYNGSGVGVGDFNNDGLADVFFGGNQVSSQLYLNQGNLLFKNCTAQAGVATSKWITGVSVVDINQDGWMDIYLSVAGLTDANNRRNILFINKGVVNGVPQFIESTKLYGLDDDSYSTMAAFFDYDRDGDLDVYLLNNWLEKFNRNNIRPKRINGEAPSNDKLFQNNGDNTFTNVSAQAGILVEGYGLGVNVSDINQDGWPDVYVSNDFMSNDLIWVNQHNGTFMNKASDYLKHQTHNGMGVDVADFNNDTLPDIVEVDMLPPGHQRQKMMTPGQNHDNFNMAVQMGYQPQYMRNTLQLNRGVMPNGHNQFSEISFMAGVSKTDWSWAPLLADFDNDGLKDLFIGNGYRKDVTNLDFIFFSMENNPFGTQETRKKKFTDELNKLPEVKVSNYIFQNKGGLTFEDKTNAWGMELPSYTNGAAYADFDNDGDLDLIVNNIDQNVFLYENQARQKKSKAHFIQFQSMDSGLYNQKIKVYTGATIQYQEMTPYRGFQSSVSTIAHFGLGEINKIDSVVISYPDQSIIRYYNLSTDTLIKFSKKESEKKPFQSKKTNLHFYFQQTFLAKYVHKETSPADIKVTRTLLHELSRYGPCVASADVDGDGLDDFFVGGEAGISSWLFVQRMDGSFTPQILSQDSTREDGGALFFDADGDGDVDLYVGGACPSSSQQAAGHQLFFNDGVGNFSLTSNLPEIKTSASCVEASDYDGDGDLDLFVGGRVKPNEYPLPPRSYILRNNHGRFTDVTAMLNGSLENPGLVSSAAWADIDNDKKIDLIITGEWMPVRIFKNEGKILREITNEVGLENSNGWWNCIEVADLNHDGFVEIIAGNTGKNSYFQPTLKEPVQIVAKDFDKNGSMDPLVTYFNPVEGERFMVYNRLVVIDQIPSIKKRFETFGQYAAMPFEKAFRKNELEGAYVGNAYSLASAMWVNKEGKSFEKMELPEIAQLSTINDILVDDVNADGQTDLVLIGNNYAQETLFGRYDASIGTVLLGYGKLKWKSEEPSQGRMVADGDAKYIRSLRTAFGKTYMVVNNNDSIDFFRVVSEGKK